MKKAKNGKKIEKIDSILNMYSECISFDNPINNDNSEPHTLIDIIENKNSVSPDNNMMNISMLQDIEELLGSLKERDKQVISLFFGLNNENHMTLADIGDKVGISKERIRQIKNRSIRKMRSSLKL